MASPDKTKPTDQIERLGGNFEYESGKADGPVVSIAFHTKSKLTDKEMEVLANFGDLKELWLDKVPVTGQGAGKDQGPHQTADALDSRCHVDF